MPTALITGITGQDGAYLARLLLARGYTVWGIVRADDRPASCKLGSLAALRIENDVRLAAAELRDTASLARVIRDSAPDEIYNLAAQSSVAQSFDTPLETGEISGLSVVCLLQAMRENQPDARFYQASSSEMYGQARETPQTEDTPFYPRSPYGAAKVYAHWMTVNYREAYGCHASCGILFNHESPLRPEQFVTRKVTTAVARIKAGLQSALVLGNLEVQRDWGFAGDYVQAMHLMLQQDTPDDYVIATGEVHSLREFVSLAFQVVGLDYREYVQSDAALFRPAEVQAVVGANGKAARKLGWSPRMKFEQLVEFLVEADIKRVRKDESNIRYVMEEAT